MAYSNVQVDAITQDVEKRIQDFMNGLFESKHVNYYVWDHLEWTQTEWDDYIAWKHIPQREFINYVEQELNHPQREKEQPMTATASFPLQRHFTCESSRVFSDIEWEKRQALITRADGEVVFQQDDVEFPKFWSQNATNIVASKYFRTINGRKENHVGNMIERVVNTIADWGMEDGYFTDSEFSTFHHELTYILVHQMASFNSPVWFNIGVPDHTPQSSACFILNVEDNMESILNWYVEEGMIFKGGSGAGVNVSKIRSKREHMSGGGRPSGPLSFMKAADASAGVIKSGGVVRRAAKMVIMDADHPDIQDFIWCKVLEERKARSLIAIGYDDGIDGEAYSSIAFQNENHSVSVLDRFLSLIDDKRALWCLTSRTTGDTVDMIPPKDLLREIAQAAWECGDPGLFFFDAVNAWHTTPSRGPIVNPNPCSEFLRPPNEACNLSSINLLKFLRDDNTFDVEGFCHTADVMITAMEILVSRSEYPIEAITKNSEDYRTLGLGYANLGALLMAKGLPYDSDEGRDYAASITALMTGQAYKRSAELAAIKGPFNGFEMNRQPMLDVIFKHLGHISSMDILGDSPICERANDIWAEAFTLGQNYGYRNAQTTLLAPTGTISFMMDCCTTGVEPDVALVNYKKLVGGGTIKHVNDMVPRALKSLGYADDGIRYILDHINEYGCVDDIYEEQHLSTNYLAPHHKAVFDCAFPSKPGGRAIAWEGHVKMVAALQPFLSGSISKTINMPHESTVEDIERAYMMAWKLGCKSIAVYRDGCKQTQVLTTQNTEDTFVVSKDVAKKVAEETIDAALKKSLAYAVVENFDLSTMENQPLDMQITVEAAPNLRGTCQTCGKSHTMLMYPYGASPALVCTACMDSIHQRIQAENTGIVVDNSYWMEKIGSLQKTVEGLEDYIQHNGKPKRQRLPDERQAITHKFSINNCEGYLTVGLFEDGTPGEIFLKMAKEGSTLSGFADGFACMVSMAFQYGIPLEVMANKFMYSRFEPSGWTPNPDIQYATSILDYVFRYLQQKFPGNGILHSGGPIQASVGDAQPLNITSSTTVPTDARTFNVRVSQPVMFTSHNVCPECGSFLQVNGACHVCKTCGFSDGCSG